MTMKAAYKVGQDVKVLWTIPGTKGPLPIDEPCVVEEVLKVRGGYRYALGCQWKGATYWVDEEAISA
jgi:hypothetical protein